MLKALELEFGPDEAAVPLGEAGGGWGGGKSAEHKALKVFVRMHPELFGAGYDKTIWSAHEEDGLRLADEIDVFLKDGLPMIGCSAAVHNGVE